MSPHTKTCPNCGGPLPPNAPGGHCVQCLLRIGLAVADGGLGLALEEPPAGEGSTLRAPHSAFEKVRYVGDYVLMEEIGRGGMGVVYRARQISLNRIVALKLVRAGDFAEQKEIARFRAEAEAAAHLDHPHIVPIYEVGENEGRHYFSLKLIEGGSLAQRIASHGSRKENGSQERPTTTLDIRTSALVIAQVARAVHYAHQRGILHRDLKPGNILLDAQGQPHITDFGLARRLGAESSMTISGAILGTPSYIAPEQAAGAKVLTTSADVYSLGAILYELLAGCPPFTGATVMETLQKVMNEEPVPPSKCEVRNARDEPKGRLSPRISHLSPDLETICLKCLEKDPARRYCSAEVLAEDLEHWLRHEPILARPVSTVERARKWIRRKPALAASAIGLLLIAGIGTAGVMWQWGVARGEAQRALAAEHQMRDKFAESLVSQARALRAGDRAGRAYESITALDLARTLRPELVTATDLIASAGLVDLRKERTPDALSQGQSSAWLDAAGNWYAVATSNLVEVVPPSGPTFILTNTHSSVSDVVGFGPDARYLAIQCKDGCLLVWNLAERRVHWQYLRRTNAIPKLVVFSPDGRSLAFASSDRELTLVNLDGVPAAATTSVSRAILALAFSPDSSRLAVGQFDFLRIYDSKRLEPLDLLPHHQDSSGMAWHPNNRWLAASGSKGVTLWDTVRGTVLVDFASGRAVTAVTFAPSGNVLLSLGNDDMLRLWDVHRAVQLLALPQTGITAQFSRDGRRLGVRTSRRDALQFFEVMGENVFQRLSWAGPTQLSARRWVFGHNRFSSDGRLLAYTVPGEVRLWDALVGHDVTSIDADQLLGLFFRPDPLEVLTYSHFHWERWPLLWDPATNVWTLGPRQWLPTHGGGTGDPVLGDLFIAHAGKNPRMVNLSNWSIQGQLTVPENVGHAHFSPDGQWLSLRTYHRQRQFIYRWPGTNWAYILTNRPNSECVAFSPDSQLLFVAVSNRIQVHKVADGQIIREIPTSAPQVMAGVFALSPDGALLVATEPPAAIRLLDAVTGRFIAGLENGSAAGVTSVHFSPDGTSLAVTRGLTGTECWNIEEIRELLSKRQIILPAAGRSPQSFKAPGLRPGAVATRILPERPQWNHWSGQLRTSLPARGRHLPASALDLRRHYTSGLFTPWHSSAPSNHLGQLLQHSSTYAGVTFDVAGWLRLGGAKPSEVDWPVAIRNIAVQRTARRLHFLHGTGLSVLDGTPVARYVVHYADGSQRVIQVRYGEHVRDWWHWNAEEPEGVPLAKLVWLPPNPASAAVPFNLRAFILSWENPKRGQVITGLDFISEMSDCAPFLLGVTTEE